MRSWWSWQRLSRKCVQKKISPGRGAHFHMTAALLFLRSSYGISMIIAWVVQGCRESFCCCLLRIVFVEFPTFRARSLDLSQSVDTRFPPWIEVCRLKVCCHTVCFVCCCLFAVVSLIDNRYTSPITVALHKPLNPMQNLLDIQRECSIHLLVASWCHLVTICSW